MNKTRLEALSDGVFAIAMTILVFEVTVPAKEQILNNAELLAALKSLIPLIASYFASFAVIATFWISHNFFYSSFTKNINRELVVLNMFYLSLISFIPFSAHVLGTFSHDEVAIALYGVNVFLIGLISIAVFEYAIYSHEIDTAEIPPRQMRQARIRSRVTPFFALAGIVAAFFNVYGLALLLFALPIIFNVIPGSLNALEKMFGFRL